MLRIPFFWDMKFVCSKLWEPNTQWRNVIAQTKGLLTQTVVKNLETRTELEERHESIMLL
jgi:hypothetical protein